MTSHPLNPRAGSGIQDGLPLDVLHGARVGMRSGAVIFWLVAILLLFWALGARELWKSESRWAEITRTMVQSGDYFHPTINGETYFKKPLFGYWAIALASTVTGEVDEWALRLPSAAAGMLALWMTVFLARRLWSAEAGRIAGWLLLTGFGFLFWSRTGQADMANVAFTITAVAWYWARRDRAGFVTSFIFYLICFVGAQMKGLGAIAVPCLAVLPDLVRDKRWKHFLTPAHAAALVLSSLVYFLPFIIESMQRGAGSIGLKDVFEQNVKRFFDPFDHQGAFYVYFYELPFFFLPWAPLLVIALLAALSKGRKLLSVDYPTRWTIEASLLIFLFFVASGSRRDYYILPLLPYCALLCARFLVSATHAKPQNLAVQLQTIVVLVLGVGGVGVAALMFVLRGRLPIQLSPGFFWGLAALSLIAIVPWVLCKRHAAMLQRVSGMKADMAVPLLGAAALMGIYVCFLPVNLDAHRTTRAFVHSVRDFLDDPEDLAFYRVSPTAVASVVFYLDGREAYPVLQNAREVARFLNDDPGDNLLMITRGAYKPLSVELARRCAIEEVAAEAARPWEDDSAKSKKWIVIRSTRTPDQPGVTPPTDVVAGPKL